MSQFQLRSAGSSASADRKRVFVVGLGLIGGSLAMALRASGRYAVMGFDIDERSADRAVALGALDRSARALYEATDADLIVVATPLLSMPSVLAELGRCLKGARGAEASVVTDVGSAKGYVLDLARKHLAPDVPFVGGHPMAGSEKSGVEHASSGLLKGCRYVLTPAAWARDIDVRAVIELCEAVGAIPQVMEPGDHDAMVAATSHLPLVVAACLARVVGERSKVRPSIWNLAAGGFRDTSRVASGDPDMGAGMLATNASQVIEALDEFQRELDEVRALITNARTSTVSSEADQEARLRAARVRQFLAKAQASRQTWIERTQEFRGFGGAPTRHDDATQEMPRPRQPSKRDAWTSPMH
ncbi:MAG: prephenate dehydrogenase/arogenate dehydrogenase family protein [Firmicutes bacterium]|nr:prephenate dehydrogenase/arogenate dehydrogenase family protein [Bacillota bacterium]MDH7495462.1 prephenate dehydrogenase/arogenate dehydrogenase family protein [Bacillota bacterium]